MENESDNILISKFIRNELSEDEKKLFAQKIKENSFREEVQLQMALFKALLRSDELEFDDKVDKSIINLDVKIKLCTDWL